MMKLRNLFLLCSIAFLTSNAVAQRNSGNRPPAAGADTSRPKPPARKPSEPKPYKEVITDEAKTQKGLFTVHKIDDKYFFEITEEAFNRDILVVSRLSKSGADLRANFIGYAGDQINNETIRFERGPNNKVFLRKLSFSEFSKDSTMPMYRAVMNSNVQPIAAAFDIKAFTPDKKGCVIDITDYLNEDNDVMYFDSRFKQALRLGAQQKDKSYVEDIRTFPINTEIRTVKTYALTNPPGNNQGGGFGGGATARGNATVEINTSMVVLPKVPMKARYFDPRVGFFTVGYTDFDADPQGVERIVMAKRWRLEPKDEDIEKYKRGELVEPKKPIVFYIDPATPEKWVPYLIQGVNDWQAAFEPAGFKNAIMAKRAPTPEEDPTWSLEDSRFSAIVYKPSDIPNASGPSIADPRSGEIMESHINWYHNVMSLVRNWYFIQTAAVDPRARKMEFDDELMGQLVRFVSSHEVGHTLGLRHNWGSSSSVPVENLRNKKWVEEHGHTPSIMDYARFNYVAQPEDNVSEIGLFPRIGDYDKWAIEWGYKWMPEYATPKDELPALNKLTIEKLKDNRLWFGTETDPNDPRCQNEDLGDDAMKAGGYGIKNLQRIVKNIETWTREPNKDYSSLNTIYGNIRSQFVRYLGHVSKNVGGIYDTPKTVEQGGVVYENVPAARQKAAMEFLRAQVFNTPTWLLDNDILNKIGDQSTDIVLSCQQSVLSRLLSPRVMENLIKAEAMDGAKAYKITDLFSDLKKFIWTEVATRKPIDVYRRNLQKAYVERLDDLLNPRQTGQISITIGRGGAITNNSLSKTSDAISVIKANLVSLRSEIRAAIPLIGDSMSRYHLQDLVDRINKALDPKS